jgi:LysM repeat protein
MSLPALPDRGAGQGGLVALMAVAFGALAITRLTGGGPDVVPAAGADGSPHPSVVASTASPTRTAPPATPVPSADGGPTRTLVPSDVQPTASAGTATPAATGAGATYKVKSGDTLSGIAAAHGTTWQVLAELNDIKDPSSLRVGQVLELR